MALIKYPRTKAQPDFQKNPADVHAASPNEAQNSIENNITIPFSKIAVMIDATGSTVASNRLFHLLKHHFNTIGRRSGRYLQYGLSCIFE